jgi:hypothetical protein
LAAYGLWGEWDNYYLAVLADRCFAGLPVVEMRQLGPSLIERRNNAAALWRPGPPQRAQAEKAARTPTTRTIHFSATPFVLCSAANEGQCYFRKVAGVKAFSKRDASESRCGHGARP